MTKINRVLLLTPFEDQVFQFYKKNISLSCQKLGKNIIILEETKSPNDLVEILSITASRIDTVIAVLDTKRDNVIYEIGFVQALGHNPIFVSHSMDCLSAFINPSDIIHHFGKKDILINSLVKKIPIVANDYRVKKKNKENIFKIDNDLIEVLANTVHNKWLAQRIKEGWVYGNSRMDDKKTHPGIMNYSKLSEAEKEYDRQTAITTIKAMINLGYKIIPPS